MKRLLLKNKLLKNDVENQDPLKVKVMIPHVGVKNLT